VVVEILTVAFPTFPPSPSYKFSPKFLKFTRPLDLLYPFQIIYFSSYPDVSLLINMLGKRFVESVNWRAVNDTYTSDDGNFPD